MSEKRRVPDDPNQLTLDFVDTELTEDEKTALAQAEKEVEKQRKKITVREHTKMKPMRAKLRYFCLTLHCIQSNTCFIMTNINTRRTIRKYSDREVSDELLGRLLGDAARTQTMGNLQLYSVVVTRSAEMKARLAPSHFNQPMVTTRMPNDLAQKYRMI